MLVYVLNKHSEPLMPCNPRKARLLLKEKRAKVVKRTPFTIQLLYASAGYKQAVSLGVDAGTKHIGLSATTEKNVCYPKLKFCYGQILLTCYRAVEAFVQQEEIERHATGNRGI
jgi:hypothetical protein